jgi:hypothetical protein
VECDGFAEFYTEVFKATYIGVDSDRWKWWLDYGFDENRNLMKSYFQGALTETKYYAGNYEKSYKKKPGLAGLLLFNEFYNFIGYFFKEIKFNGSCFRDNKAFVKQKYFV